jgi:hypothetical protein
MSICVWCEAEYTKRTNNQKYCSIACQLERKNSEQQKGYRKVYDYRKLEPSWITYDTTNKQILVNTPLSEKNPRLS